MRVSELIERLSKFDPNALVVLEDNELGFEVGFEVMEVPAVVRWNADNPFRAILVDYVFAGRDNGPVESVVALTMFGLETVEPAGWPR